MQDLPFPPCLQWLLCQANHAHSFLPLGPVLPQIAWNLFSKNFVEPASHWTTHSCTPEGPCPWHLCGSIFYCLQLWLKSHLVREALPDYPLLKVSLYSYPGHPLPCLISVCCTSCFQMFYKINFLYYYCLPSLKCSSKMARIFIYLAHSLICLKRGPNPSWSSINIFKMNEWINHSWSHTKPDVQ